MDFSDMLMGTVALLGLIASYWIEYHNKPRPMSRRRLRLWQKAAASCAQVVEKGPPLRARAGALDVRIDPLGDQDLQISVVVPGPPDFQKVRICPKAEANPWLQDIEVRDAWFDRTFCVEGPIRLVFALLDGRTRHLLRHCVDPKSRLAISLGEIRAVIPLQRLSFILPHLLELGQRLAQPLDVLQRVAENAREDPEAGVRLQNLLVLVHELPGNPMTIEALRTACSDASPEIRLRAAKELGPEGRDILLEFAESREDDAFSAGAVSILDRELPVERMKAILDHAQDERSIQTARACLEVLGRRGDAAAVDMLAEVLAFESTLETDELAVAAAQALEATGNPAAEPPLIPALQSEHADLRVAAANALGRVGSVAAVLPLEEAESFLRDAELRRAARQAIAEIQARLPGASPGQLSMAEVETGQLSLAPEAGQLSYATDAAGQLSLLSQPGQPPQEAREVPAGRRV